MNTNRFQTRRRTVLPHYLGVGPGFWIMSAVAAAGILVAVYCLLTFRLSI
jgi:hypothetical protein